MATHHRTQDVLTELLLSLRSIVGDLKEEPTANDDGIPVLRHTLAHLEKLSNAPIRIGADIPTLSAVLGQPETTHQIDAFETSKTTALQAQTLARIVIRRLTRIWAETGNAPLEPEMIIALERALHEALQTSQPDSSKP